MDDALREWIDEKLADCYKKKESWHAYSIHPPPEVKDYTPPVPQTIPPTLKGRWWLNDEIDEKVKYYEREIKISKPEWIPKLATFRKSSYSTHIIDQLLSIPPYYMTGYQRILKAILKFNENISKPPSDAPFDMDKETNAALLILQEHDLDRRTTALCFYKGCRMLCASSENLMIHTEHHKYETKFRCEHCRMNFLGKVSLRIHQTDYLHRPIEVGPPT